MNPALAIEYYSSFSGGADAVTFNVAPSSFPSDISIISDKKSSEEKNVKKDLSWLSDTITFPVDEINSITADINTIYLNKIKETTLIMSRMLNTIHESQMESLIEIMNSLRDIYNAAQKSKTIDALLKIRDLKNNWDGRGAKKFSNKLIRKAMGIIELINTPPNIFPTTRNSIQIDFDNKNDYLEFEIYDDKIFAYQESVDGLNDGREIDKTEIVEILEGFYA